MRLKRDNAVSTTVNYIVTAGIISVILVITGLIATDVFIVQPADTLMYYSFIDIANGVSTRIVDISSIAPPDGSITTNFDLPMVVSR